MSLIRKPRRARFELLESRQMLSATPLPATGLGDDAPRLLFVRGGDRTGGFLEAGNDAARTEQLSDINNFSTSGGNHGWGELRQTLETAGFVVEQITEGSETASGPADGIALDFAAMDLSAYDAVVFGSNNAVYTSASVDAVESYIRGGGSALFISDANFGGDWADASDSDQQFLDRFGLVAHQDQGTYSITRSDGEFLVPNHPIFTNVNRFDGEGVTPIRVETPTDGVSTTILAAAEGQTRLNEPPFANNNQGPSRAAGPNDAVSLVASVDDGKIAGHFDRNTFFNLNGAGTNINRFDNEQYALNLFGWLVGSFDPIPGDYDGDGTVDDADRGVWAAAYGAVGSSPVDGNGDGVVDALDFVVWRENEGHTGPAVDLTPPPAIAFFAAPPRLLSDQPTPRRASLSQRSASTAELDLALLLIESGDFKSQEQRYERQETGVEVDQAPFEAAIAGWNDFGIG